jgi:hypothetical protein
MPGVLDLSIVFGENANASAEKIARLIRRENLK